MLALVMSGAANYGAMQAGALEVLLEAGVRPEITVGSSAGALNAIFLAAEPTLVGMRKLQNLWRAAGPDEVGVPKPLIAIRRLVAQCDGLVANDQLALFLEENLPRQVETFGQLTQGSGIRAYAVAVCVEDGELVVFGDRGTDRLLDGAMASTAIPPFFPPWHVDDQRYLDGGVYTKLPIRVAIERGATRVIALDVSHPLGSAETARGVLGISGYALSLMMNAQTETEIAWTQATGVLLRVIHLTAPVDVPFWDYSQAERLIRLGREIASQELEAEPLRRRPNWWIRIRQGLIDLWTRWT